MPTKTGGDWISHSVMTALKKAQVGWEKSGGFLITYTNPATQQFHSWAFGLEK